MLMKDLTLPCENGHLPAVLQCLILWESVKVTRNGFWVLPLWVELSATQEPAVLLLGINIDNKGLITPLTFPCDNEEQGQRASFILLLWSFCVCLTCTIHWRAAAARLQILRVVCSGWLLTGCCVSSVQAAYTSSSSKILAHD